MVYVDDRWVWWTSDSSIASGQPGVGVRGAPSGNSISQAKLGPRYTGTPTAVTQESVALSTFPNRVDMQWYGVSDGANGPGIYMYQIWRNGTLIGSTNANPTDPVVNWTAGATDTMVQPGTTYQYQIEACDFHWNTSTATITVTTPPTGQVDPRRTGVRPNGSYWGGSGENVDLLSGNLSYTLPLLKGMGRGGWSVGISLSYNSQNWRQDGSTS